MNYSKTFCIWLTSILLASSIISFANVAQPGIRNAGGASDFSLLFPEDSTSFRKIQMQKERISIQLYKGFAVVKGEYWMLNETPDTIKMKAGYPIDAIYSTHKEGYSLTEIAFNEIYGIKVYLDGKEIKTEEQILSVPGTGKLDLGYEDNSKWHVWGAAFKPGGVTKFSVYFILNTNESSVLEGYDSETPNGFVYVIETAATWKPPIGSGTIIVQLNDGLQMEDIHGVSPESAFVHDKEQNLFIHHFKDLVPTNKNNLAITYSERIENLDFKAIIERSESLFESIDQLSKAEVKLDATSPITFNSPFDIPNPGSTAIGAIFLLAIYGPPILIGLGVLLIIYFLWKRFRKSRS